MRTRMIIPMLVALLIPIPAFAQEVTWEKQFEAGLSALKEGRLGDAEKLLRDTLEQAKKSPTNDERLAANMFALGVVYQRQAKFSSAEPLLEQALTMMEQSWHRTPLWRDWMRCVCNMINLPPSEG